MKIKLTSILLLFLIVNSFSQKKPLNHDIYDKWKQLSEVIIGNNGKYASFISNHLNKRGDGTLFIKSLKGDFMDSISRANKSRITYDGKILITQVKAGYDTIYKMRLKGKRDLPLDSLKVYSLDSTKLIYSDNFVLGYNIPKENSDVLIYTRHKRKVSYEDVYEDIPDSLFIGEKGNALGIKKYYKKELRKKEKEKETVIINLKTLKTTIVDNVVSYYFPKKGNNIYLIRKKEKKKEKKIKKNKIPAKQYISYFNFNKNEISILDSTSNFYKSVGVNEKGDKIAFLYSNDSLKIKKEDIKYSVGYSFFNKKGKIISIKITAKNKGIPQGWGISEYSNLRFSESGNRLFFNTKPTENKIKKDTTLLKSDKPVVDLWSWDDKIIQPQQKSNYKKLLTKDYTAMYDINRRKITQLERKDDDGIILKTGDENYFYVFKTVDPIRNTWRYPFASNYFSVDPKTGTRKIILKDQVYGMSTSPKGNYFAFFNQKTKNWNVFNTKSNKLISSSKNINTVLFNEKFDTPSIIPPYGTLGWSKDETKLYVKDMYDIWEISIKGGIIKNITNSYGRNNKIRFNWINVEKRDFKGFDNNLKSLLLTGFNEKTKANEIYSLNVVNGSIKKILEGENNDYRFISKSKNSNTILFLKEGVKDYPDLYSLDLDNSKIKKLSNINPERKEYNWGTVELTNWESYSGRKLEGLIYKPENFNPNKKYPMIVYFYDRSSHRKNAYKKQVPLWSIINPIYCASNGYIVFIPDIIYKKGEPGEDAYDCIMSGVDMMEKTGYVDTKKMALQGQSWGGYQTAYLVTRSNKFACAMAGAPVSNMTSAYGGIRWQSGMNRSFQYENGQSRIGESLWENREAYIKNSPVFFADKVTTPLLIMHNDGDGAVPWYQGIEYYIALRRFKKPVWMLNYNGDAHNLRKWANRVDLSIRMMQFFDYYLKGEKKPKWLDSGIDQVQKRKEYRGYELK